MAAKANPFVRAGKYFSAWFGAKVDERADPKVQIQQAIEEAQRQHQALTQQAASVIGNQRQLEMKLDRQLGQVETLQQQTRQALVLADNARAGGDSAKAGEFEETAQALANQLVGAERGVEDLKALHDQALQAAGQAREAVRTNATLLEEKLAQRTRLLSQLEQAKMQEQVSSSLNQMSELAAPSNVPTLDEVRDKIERRYATALGQADLASATPAARMMEVRKATADLQGAERLAEIRASMPAPGRAVSGSSPAGAIAAGTAAGDPVPEAAPGTAALPSEQGADAPNVSTEKQP